MTLLAPAATDEKRHDALRTDDRYWGESWYFDFVSDDAKVGGYVRLGFYPNLDTAWYWACLVREGEPLVTVIEHDVSIPVGESLEVRATDLWADHRCEEPLGRWSLGLEAFGVVLDHPTDVYRRAIGDKVPFGFDLEWETDGSPYHYPDDVTRYEVPCTVHGGIKLGEETIEFSGIGQRDHSWGVRDWWSMSWCWIAGRFEDGSRFHSATVHVLPELDFVAGYHQSPQGQVEVREGSAVATATEEGLASGITVTVGDLVVEVDPVAWSPVRLDSPEGELSLFPRAMCRFIDTTGRSGTGWIEFNFPQSP